MDRFVQRRLHGSALPTRLADLPDPPTELWLAGALPRIAAVGIVGTRHPTAEAEAFALVLARDLCREGALVVSGGALGIDTAAHRGALAAGGATLVVAPAGLQRPYPEQNAELFDAVLAAGGGYLSLRAPHEPAQLASFFDRNALLAALCDFVVVVQAPFRSGARNAAAAARKLGRPLGVVPNPPWEPMGRGCIAELRLGGIAVSSGRDVVECLRARGALLLPPKPSGPLPDACSWADRRAQEASVAPAVERCSRAHVSQLPLFDVGAADPSPENAVTRAIASGGRSIDAVVEATGLAISLVQSVLLGLELDGTIVRDAAEGYRLSRQ